MRRSLRHLPSTSSLRGQRVSIVLSATALAVACTGVTPAEALKTVKTAFATNAGAVNGIKASVSPAAGQLLPLGADGKFPSSVLPAGARGPRGASGPQGDTGARGPSDVFTTQHDSVPLPTSTAGLDVATLNVPAGNYLVIAAGAIVYQDPGVSGSDYFRCRIGFGNAPATQMMVTRIGPDATPGAAIAGERGGTMSAAGVIHLNCNHDVAIGAGNPRADNVELTAIRTDNLQVQ